MEGRGKEGKLKGGGKGKNEGGKEAGKWRKELEQGKEEEERRAG